MANFAKKKIALAVGTSLLAMAGSAQAATAANPTVRSHGIIATVGSAATAQNLYAATGYNGAVTITVYLTPAADTLAGDTQAISDAALTVNGQTVAGVGSANNANDFTVTYNTTTPVYFPVSAVGFTGNTTAGGVAGLASANPAAFFAQATFTIAPVAGDANPAFRINGANLEYTQNKLAATPVWNVVNVQGLTAATNPITATDSGATTAVTFTSAAAPAVMGTAPTPKLSTHSTSTVAGGAQIDGITIDTLTPISTLTKTTNFTVAAVGSATTGCAGSTVADAKDITAGATGTVASTGTANTVLFATPATVTWTNSTATDAAAYSTNCFNTGVAGTQVPFAVTLVPGTEPAYTSVYVPGTGLAAKMAALPANVNIQDGAVPVLVKAESQTGAAAGTTDLVLTYSEDLKTIQNNDLTVDTEDLREIAENVFLNTDTLAALNLNNGGTLAATLSDNAGQGVLTITGAASTDVAGKTVTVKTGISIKEQNDVGYSATTPALDNLGGLKSAASNEIIPTNTPAATISPVPTTLAFTTANTKITASAVDNGAGKVASVTVKFSSPVKLATGKTVADLASDLVVGIKANAGAATPVSFNIYPAAADLTNGLGIAADGLSMTIALPTALIYSKLNDTNAHLDGITVTYSTTNVADVFTGLTDPKLTVLAGTENVKLPLSLTATATDTGLLKQTVQATVTGAASGDTVTAYLGEWLDTSVKGKGVASIVWNTNDSAAIGTIGNNLLEGYNTNSGWNQSGGYKDSDDLLRMIQTQLDNAAAAVAKLDGVTNAVAEVKPQPIPGYLVGNKLYVADDGNGVPDAQTAYEQALSDADSNVAYELRSAADSAGRAGATATGADMSTANTNSGATSNPGSLNAAMNAGVAAALASVSNYFNSGYTGAWNQSYYPVGLFDSVIAAATKAANQPNATVSSVVAAILSGMPATGTAGFVQAVTIDPASGAIMQGTKQVAKLNLTVDYSGSGNRARGLHVLNSNSAVGATMVTSSGTTGSGKFNLLSGVELGSTNIDAAKAKKYFLLLVHTSATTGANTLLTSADPLAANFLPFVPDWFNTAGTATDLGTIDPAKLRKVVPNASSSNWQLVGLGSLDRKATAPAGYASATPGAAFTRAFVGLDGSGNPVGLWAPTNGASDASAGGSDMALALAANKTAVATELGDKKETLSTIDLTTSVVKNSAALAWQNDNNDHTKALFLLQTAATSPDVTLPVGWSLVTVPTTGTLNAGTNSGTTLTKGVQAVLRLGAAAYGSSAGQTTWFAADGGTPSVTAGEAVFVYSKAGGKL